MTVASNNILATLHPSPERRTPGTSPGVALTSPNRFPSSPDRFTSASARLLLGPGPAEHTLRRCVGELLDPATVAAARRVACQVTALPGAHHDLAVACIAAAVHNQIPMRTATRIWAPRRRGPLAEIITGVVEQVMPLEIAAVEVAALLLDDRFEGSIEQLFSAAVALSRE